MGKLKSSLTCLWFYVAIALACFLPYRELYNPNSLSGDSNFALFYIVSGITILTFVVYFVAEHWKNKMRVDIVLLLLFMLLVAINIVAIWTNYDHMSFYDYESMMYKEVVITTNEKIYDTICLCIMFIVAYASSFVLGRHKVCSSKLGWFSFVIALAGVVACGISFVKDILVNLIVNNENLFAATTGASSFFGNENVFAMFLFFCTIACFIVMYHMPKTKWMWSFVVLFYIFIIFSTSATGAVITTLLILVNMLFEIIKCFATKRYVMATVAACIFITALVGIIILVAIGYNYGLPYISKIVEFINRSVATKDVTSLSGRKKLWDISIQIVSRDPFRAAFGYGFGTSNTVFALEVNNDASYYFPHSGIFQILISFGWVGVGIYCLLLVYYVYCIIRLMAKKKGIFATFYLLLTLCVLFYEIFESYYMFELSAFGLFATLIVFLPPIVAWKQTKHTSFQEDIKFAYAVPTQGAASKNFVPAVAATIISVLIPTTLSLICSNVFEGVLFNVWILIIGFLVVSLIFVPYLSFLWYKKTNDGKFVEHFMDIRNSCRICCYCVC